MRRLTLATVLPLLLIGCGRPAPTGETYLVAAAFEKAAEACNASVVAGSPFASVSQCLEMLNYERGYRAFRADQIDGKVSDAELADLNETAARAYEFGAEAMRKGGISDRKLLDRFGARNGRMDAIGHEGRVG